MKEQAEERSPPAGGCWWAAGGPLDEPMGAVKYLLFCPVAIFVGPPLIVLLISHVACLGLTFVLGGAAWKLVFTVHICLKARCTLLVWTHTDI